MTDEQIRQAFEKWQADHNPTQYPAEREAFSDGWKAALASLEKTCWLKANGDAVYLDKPDEVFQYEPLYRIKEKS